MTRSALVVGLLALACESDRPPEVLKTDAGTSSCPIFDDPTFILGTGESEFQPIEEGAELEMAQGLQGGCHFWVSVRTHGFAQRRCEIAYAVDDAITGEETPSRSRTRVLLSRVPDSEDCQFVGMTAFLIEPWTLEDRRLRLTVTVTDDLGRTASEAREIIARAVPGTICGGPR